MRREDLPTGAHVRVTAVLTVPGDARTRAFNPGDRMFVQHPNLVPDEWLDGIEAVEQPPPAEPAPSGQVPAGSVDDVLRWVGDDHGRAAAALDAERARDKPRSTLVGTLESMLYPLVEAPPVEEAGHGG